MAIVTRYFSTSSAGAADGTTWADRAVLFSGGAWSSVITGFNFSGSDSLKCMIGPGTHTITASLASGSFANPPTLANPLVFSGCDSSGNQLAVPNPGWKSPQPAWDDSTLPVIATTTNVITINLPLLVVCHLLKFTATARAGAVVTIGSLSWCVVSNSHTNTGVTAISGGPSSSYGCVFSCTGTSYSAVVSGALSVHNCRVTGVTGSSGNRHGIVQSGNTNGFSVVGCTVYGVGGGGLVGTSTQTGQAWHLRGNTVAGCGSHGVSGHPTASQQNNYTVFNNLITGCGGYGVFNDASGMACTTNRLRDNTSGAFSIGNYPTDLNNDTTDSDDATEYVDAGNGDYRIKYGSAIWGKGYGAGDEPAPTGGAVSANMRGGFVN